MLYFLIAVGLFVHTYFWGVGLAGLVVPPRWRRWWWAFAPGLGWALQSALVWAGAHSGLAGTAVYARWSEVIPLLLLIWAWRRAADRKILWRSLSFKSWAGLAGVMIVTGTVLVWPMAQAGRGVTASSLGSCDHADYAAGARVFQEFSRDDHTGFLGLPEVTKVRSADYFFDYCLRINHFTPAALLAHNGAVFGMEFYRLVSVSTALLVVLNLPLLFLLGRISMGIRGVWLLALGVLYGLSPLNAYAVHHGALGQLYAAQGIALLTFSVWAAERAARLHRGMWAYGCLALAAFWLLAGSYNFILLVCLAPAGTWLCIQWWRFRDTAAMGRVIGMLALALALCAVLFWGRFNGLIERFGLYEQYDFGWVVPLLTPAGWLGLVKNAQLETWEIAGWPVVNGLAALVVFIWAWGLFALWRRKKHFFWWALALVLPVAFGWGVLAWESRVRANASYDAYKIVSVFYPGLLIGICCWFTPARLGGRLGRWSVGAVLVVILILNIMVARLFVQAMGTPPLRVDRALVDLGRLEQDTRFASFNMCVENFWARLWANAFLLKKPQYFMTHTYEARLNTALKGEWNLSDSMLRVAPMAEEDYVQVNGRFHLARVAAPGLLAAGFADGWYDEEQAAAFRWRWSDGRGRIVLTNPTGRPVRVELRLRVRGLVAGEMTLQLGTRVVGKKILDGSIQDVGFSRLHIPPGQTMLVLAYPSPAVSDKAGGDQRGIALALYRFQLHAVAWDD